MANRGRRHKHKKMLTIKLERKTQPKIEAHVKV